MPMTEFDKMVRLLDMSWLLREEIVPCLVGPPGIGKTAAVRQHAKAHGCGKVVKIVASRCVPSETVGMTMPDHEHRSMEIYNSLQLSSLEDGDILFLDELLEADQFVLSTMLTLIESREMADGTPLPDIQIIAATNDTIPADQLRGNIRQRFMFQRFKIDSEQTFQYIRNMTGMEMPKEVLKKLTDTGGDYNFLTPRSLTKLCLWIDKADNDEQATEVAKVINDIWDMSIGTEILKARQDRDAKVEAPDKQVRNAIINIIASDTIDSALHGRKAICESVPDNFDFDECTMDELLSMLQGLPEWEKIAEELSKMDVVEQEHADVDVEF